MRRPPSHFDESVWFLRLRRVMTGIIVTCRRRFRPDTKVRNSRRTAGATASASPCSPGGRNSKAAEQFADAFYKHCHKNLAFLPSIEMKAYPIPESPKFIENGTFVESSCNRRFQGPPFGNSSP